MKLDVDKMICGLDGKGIPKDEAGEPTLLKDVCIAALISELPGDREKATGDEKFKRFLLAGKVNGGGVVDVSADEVAMLKERIGKGYGAVIVGPAWTLLEALKS